MRRSLFAVADGDSVFDDGWFRNQFRCSKASFDCICSMVHQHWLSVNDPIGMNVVRIFIRDRTAVTMFYVTHPGSLAEATSLFGMSKATALRYLKQVVGILVTSILPLTVRLPQTDSGWDRLAKGFENICGFPNSVLAVDGCLFEIERPHDFEGWYCRKGFPAINVQMADDHKARVRSFDMRAGSANDKAVFNYSSFGASITDTIPPGKHERTGYAILEQMMTPYPVKRNAP